MRWPAMMRRKTAAEYLDMAETTFEREVAIGNLPAGVMFGGKMHWHKDALDKAVEAIAGEGVPEWRRKLHAPSKAA